MDEKDADELRERRTAEAIAGRVERQIKERYFWVAIIFGIVSWFGGLELIKSEVAVHIGQEMKPYETELATAKVQVTQLTEFGKKLDTKEQELDRLLKEADEKRLNLAKEQDRIAHSQAAIESELKVLGSSTEALTQLVEYSRMSRRAILDTTRKCDATSDAIDKLKNEDDVFSFVNVTIRAGSNMPAEALKDIKESIEHDRKFRVSIEGGKNFVGSSSLRYYYTDDMDSAKKIADIANKSLETLQSASRVVPIPLTGAVEKAPYPYVELWLNP